VIRPTNQLQYWPTPPRRRPTIALDTDSKRHLLAMLITLLAALAMILISLAMFHGIL
jgi:hypothetical protein